MAKQRAKRKPRVKKWIGDTPAEKRAARKAAAVQCAAERRRLKSWVPAERRRVAGELHTQAAELDQKISMLRAQHREAVKATRADLATRIKQARANARQGFCVDMAAGPIVRRFGPRAPAHMRKGAQTPLFSTAPPAAFGGKLGAPYRVRGATFPNEKAALSSVLRHLRHDQGGIVVLEQWNGSGYGDGPYYGLDATGKQLEELDPLDPRGHHKGRAAKLAGFGASRDVHEAINAVSKKKVAANERVARELERRGLSRPVSERDHRPVWGTPPASSSPPSSRGTERVRIVYGTDKGPGGFVAAVDVDGRRRIVDGRWADRDVALQRAKEHAEEIASRYAGDWDVKVERERASTIPPAPKKKRATKSRVPGAGTRQQYAGATAKRSSAPPPPAKRKKRKSTPKRSAKRARRSSAVGAGFAERMAAARAAKSKRRRPAGRASAPAPADPRPSWGSEWGSLGFKKKWMQAGALIKAGGIYGEENRPHFTVQWSLNEGHQFRHGQYGWQLREKAGKVQLHVKSHDYWSTIGDADTLTFGELYAGCIKRYYMTIKQLKQAEGEYKAKPRYKATLPTEHRWTGQGTREEATFVARVAGKARAAKLDSSRAHLGLGTVVRNAKSTGGRFRVYVVADGDDEFVGDRKTRGGAEQLAAKLAQKHKLATIHGWYVQPRDRGQEVRTSTFDLKQPHFRIIG